VNSIFRLPNIISEFKYSIKLAIPLIAAEVIHGLNNFIATAMVAHLGKEQLAANALVWSIYLAVILFFVGIFCAVGVMSAQSFGAKDNTGTGICFKQGLIMAIISSLPMMLIMWGMPLILALTKQDPIVIAYAKPFFHSLSWSMLPLGIIVVIQQFLSGITKARLVMFMTILQIPIEVFFYYAFLFGKFGLPKLDLAGIGYGLTISYSIILLFFCCYLHFSRQFKIYSLFKKWWVIEYKFFIEIIRIGLPLGLTFCSELVFFAIVAIMMGILGVEVLAAYQIAYQFLMIGLMVLFGLCQTVTVRVGNEVGSNNRGKLKLTAMVNMIIGLVLISAFSIFYLSFPETAISLDIDVNLDKFKSVASIALRFFPIISILLVTECIRLISFGALRGLKDSSFQMMISVFGFWLIAFPTAYLLGFKLGLGGIGIWWGIVIGLFITGIMLLVRFNRLVNRIDLLSLVTKK
jgi:multidrug resistance protein, MATE family